MSDRRAPRELRAGFVAAILGGILGWVVYFAGSGLWGFPVGAAWVVAYIAYSSRRRRSDWKPVAGYAFAAVMLTWPLLWLLVGLIWSWF